MNRGFALDLALGGIAPVALALVAWGADDVGGFTAGARRVTFVVLTLVYAVALAYIRSRFSVPRRTGNPFQPASGILAALETMLVVAAFGDRRAIGELPEVAAGPGMLLYLLGGAAGVWTALVYARDRVNNPAPVGDLPPLDLPPFRRVRFPAELGILLRGAGTALLFRSFPSLFLWFWLLLTTIRWIVRQDNEWQLLYGGRWALYTRGNWRLIPFVY